MMFTTPTARRNTSLQWHHTHVRRPSPPGPLPRLLLLDEPFGALDPQVRASLRRGLKQIIDRVGITGIFVTHDQVRKKGVWERAPCNR